MGWILEHDHNEGNPTCQSVTLPLAKAGNFLQQGVGVPTRTREYLMQHFGHDHVHRQMPVKVNFCGALGEEFKPVALHVKTPSEVIGLMEANYPGFRQKLLAGRYVMVLHDGTEREGSAVAVHVDSANIPMSGENVYFVPAPEGEGGATFIYLTSQLVIATGVSSMTGVYIAAAVVAVGMIVGYIAIAMALSSLADWLMPGVEERGDESIAFNGPVNNTRQGNPVPVCYGGPIRVGSQVISVDLKAVDI